VRWGTLAVGVALAQSSGHFMRRLPWVLALVAYAAFRTIRPLSYRRRGLAAQLPLVAEIVLFWVAVVSTGYWLSPFFFCLATAIVAASFAGGSQLGLTAAGLAVIGVAIPFHLLVRTATAEITIVWGSELLLISMVTGYARSVFYAAEARTSLALDRVSRLSEANDLLVDLHRVAQTLPASLDLAETVSSTVQRLRELFEPDVIAILIREESPPGWTTMASEGTRLPHFYPEAGLPGPLQRVTHRPGAHLVSDLAGDHQVGLAAASRCGLYAPLRARNTLIGLLAVEHREPGRLRTREIGLMDGLAEQAALALDNARWFGRLRTVGADEERTRIARDLHDRVGQSLAYLAFELDRITGGAQDLSIHPDLINLRQDVRRVVGEVRDTLYDLRTDVSESQDLVAILEAFLQRVHARTGVAVALRHETTRRLPLPQERELWRIAQEAVTNAERHAKCTCISVTWRCDESGAVLDVVDDGQGLPETTTSGRGSYGIIGMRERADAIGARLELTSSPGKGTTLRCTLGRDVS
jgi:signal transduction histidine kinase